MVESEENKQNAQEASTAGTPQEETKVMQPQTVAEEEMTENALRDNIKRKGQNSVSLPM